MLWTPYDQDEMVVESPPYQRRNQIFAYQPAADSKGLPPAKLREISSSSHLVPAAAATSRFSFPFISSIRSGALATSSSANQNQQQQLPSYEEIAVNKRLSMPPHPYVVPGTGRGGINQSFTDEFISRRSHEQVNKHLTVILIRIEEKRAVKKYLQLGFALTTVNPRRALSNLV